MDINFINNRGILPRYCSALCRVGGGACGWLQGIRVLAPDRLMKDKTKGHKQLELGPSRLAHRNVC